MDIQASIPIDSVTIGGRNFTDIKNLKILVAKTTVAKYTSFLNPDLTAYEVPAGKVFHILAIRQNQNNGSVNSFTALGYGDSAVVDSVGGPASPVFYGGGGGLIGYATAPYPDAPERALDFAVPAGKFPFILGISTDVGSIIYGYEE